MNRFKLDIDYNRNNAYSCLDYLSVSHSPDTRVLREQLYVQEVQYDQYVFSQFLLVQI